MQLSSFTTRRFIQVFVIAFVVLTSVYMLRGQPAIGAVRDAALWSLITATVAAGATLYYRRTSKACKLCVEETKQQSPEN